VADMAQPIA